MTVSFRRRVGGSGLWLNFTGSLEGIGDKLYELMVGKRIFGAIPRLV